jgi:hypothetical protein
MKILVCGFGRCGSSLVLQMLKAGGVDCHGEFPAFEPEDVNLDRNMNTLLPKLEGKAAKILDPHRSQWPQAKDVRIIWLDRNFEEQAKSQIKFLKILSGIKVPHEKEAIKKLAASYGPDRDACFKIFKNKRFEVMEMFFEDIIENPAQAATNLINFLELDSDPVTMGSVVFKRNPACAKGLEIEAALCGGH